MTAAPRRSPVARYAAGALVLAAIGVLLALGVWQVERRAWKLDLIAQVNTRIHAPAVEAPAQVDWPALTVVKDGYKHVRVQGDYLNDQTVYVHATTEYGMGYWVLTPLRTAQGFNVFVNRGFVAADQRGKAAPAAKGTVTGLLRLSEPARWPRANDPAHENWYSRDIAAMADARGLQQPAPYFIDADTPEKHQDAAPAGADSPIAGLTIVDFPNNHFIYACTWFGLAVLLAFGAGKALRRA